MATTYGVGSVAVAAARRPNSAARSSSCDVIAMRPARRRLYVRRLYVPEDAADGAELWVRCRDARPEWICEGPDCDHRNDGFRDACAMCGSPRMDGWE